MGFLFLEPVNQFRFIVEKLSAMSPNQPRLLRSGLIKSMMPCSAVGILISLGVEMGGVSDAVDQKFESQAGVVVYWVVSERSGI